VLTLIIPVFDERQTLEYIKAVEKQYLNIGGDILNAVDNNTCNEDNSDPADFGNETNFAYAQNTTPEATYMNIQENNTVSGGADEWRYVDDISTPETIWSTVGLSPYINTQDEPNNYIWVEKGNGETTSWYTFDNTSATGSGFSVNLSIYHYETGDGYPQWEIDTNNDGNADHSGSFFHLGSYAWAFTSTISGLDTASEINNARVRFIVNKGDGGPDNSYIDCARLGIFQSSSSNYQIDFEYNWTTADHTETNEQVCFYVQNVPAGEDLNVSY